MSMGKGLLPARIPQAQARPRSKPVLKDSDVVMLIGRASTGCSRTARAKTWGSAPKKFIQIDTRAQEMDSNVEIAAPVVGDIGSCVSALLPPWATGGPRRGDWMARIASKREENVAKMAPRLMNNNSPMDYHGALGVLRTIVKERPTPSW